MRAEYRGAECGSRVAGVKMSVSVECDGVEWIG